MLVIMSPLTGASAAQPKKERSFLQKMVQVPGKVSDSMHDTWRSLRGEENGSPASSFDLQDEGDHYQVRAYLPNRDVENVSVTVENDTLKIDAEVREGSKKDGASGAYEGMPTSNYAQRITLPGTVKSDKLAVSRREGMLVISVPKG